jgi:hypothetical protein
MAAVDVFVDAGVICHEQGTLAQGLELLAARLDYAGAGELVAELCGLEFTDSDDKRDPKPVPTPKPPPKPKERS